MKRWIVLLAVVAISLPLASCSKKSSGESGKYDPKVDAPPTLAKAPSDPGIADRQEKYENGIQIAAPVAPPTATSNPAGAAVTPEKSPAAATPEKGPAAGTPASAEETAAIKAMLTQMNKDVAADIENFANYWDTKEAPTVKKFIIEAKGIIAKMDALKTAAKAKGITLPGDIGGPKDSTTGMATAMTNAFTPDRVKILKDGDVIVIVDAEGDKHPTVKSADGYKLAMSEKDRKMLPFAGELFTALNKMLDAMTAGINDGSITNANIKQKSDELGKQYMAPVMGKMMTSMPH